MAEKTKSYEQFRSRRDFAPGVVAIGFRRLSDLAYFVGKLINVNYPDHSVEFLSLPTRVQNELDAAELKPKQVPAELLLPNSKPGHRPQIDRVSARIANPDISLTGFAEEEIALGRVISLELRGRLRFFTGQERNPPVAAGEVSRAFTFFELLSSPNELKISFGLLSVLKTDSKATPDDVAKAIIALQKLEQAHAVELSRVGSSSLRAARVAKNAIARPYRGFESGDSESRRRKH